MIKSASVRIVLFLSLTHKWCLCQVHINNVFLHVELTEEVYVVKPPGFEQIFESSHPVCNLQKALHGPKHAPRAWFEKLKSFMLTELGLRLSVADSCLLIKSNNNFLFFYCLC